MAGNNSKIGNRINRKAGTPSLMEAFGSADTAETVNTEAEQGTANAEVLQGTVNEDTSANAVQNGVSGQFTVNQPVANQPDAEASNVVEQPMHKPTVEELKEAQQVIGMANEMTNAYADIKANTAIVENSEQTAQLALVSDVVRDILREFLVGHQVVNSAEFEAIAVDEKKLADALEQSLGATGRDLVPTITNALMKKNNTASAYIAQCLPKNVKKCRECMFREACNKSLVTYPCKRACITLPADVNEALDIMFKEAPEYRNMTKSSFITTLLRRQVEQYIPAARKKLDEKMLLNAKMELEANTMANKILTVAGEAVHNNNT